MTVKLIVVIFPLQHCTWRNLGTLKVSKFVSCSKQLFAFVYKGINLASKLSMRGMNILKFQKFDHGFLFPFSNDQHFDPPPPNGQNPLPGARSNFDRPLRDTHTVPLTL